MVISVMRSPQVTTWLVSLVSVVLTSNACADESKKFAIKPSERAVWEPRVCKVAERALGTCRAIEVTHLEFATAGRVTQVLYCASVWADTRGCWPDQATAVSYFLSPRDGRSAPHPTLAAGASDDGEGPDYFYRAHVKEVDGVEYLIAPTRMSGTGNSNTSNYYRIEGETFVRLQANLEKELSRRLPKGMAVWKGIWPDFNSMRFIRPLWKRGDGNCCPSAGVAVGEVQFTPTALEIKSVRIFKGEAAITREIAKWDKAHRKAAR
jgi:hypothetical protein